jgi:hypothetical protein
MARLRTPELVFTDEERKAIERQFPEYSIFLAEDGAFSKPAESGKATPLPLPPPLRANEAEKLAPRMPALTGEQKNYCRRYMAYRNRLSNIEELREYKRILENQTVGDANNLNENLVKKRVFDRLQALEKESSDQEIALIAESQKVRAQARWFQNGYCLK